MAEIPVPPGKGVPLVDMSTMLLPDPMVAVMDERYSSSSVGGGNVYRVIVATGNEARPAEAGAQDLVIWWDVREDVDPLSDQPASMGQLDEWRVVGGGLVLTAPVITTTTLASMTEGAAYNQTISYLGDVADTATVTVGTLPAGLTLGVAAGVITITGTPTTPGAYSFTVEVANSVGSDTQEYSGTVNADVPVILLPEFVGTGTEHAMNASVGASTWNHPLPAGATAGEYLLVSVRSQSNVGGGTNSIDGGDLLLIGPFNTSDWRANYVFGKFLTATDITNGYVAMQVSTTTTQRLAAVARRVINVDPTDPVIATSTDTPTVPTAGTVTVDSFSSEAGGLAVYFFQAEFSPGADHVPTTAPGDLDFDHSAMNPIGGTTAVSRTYEWVGSRESAATEPDTTMAWTGASSPWAGAVVLRGAEE